MTDRVELREKVFAPGNLVHGLKIGDFRSCVDRGIKPPSSLPNRIRGLSLYPDEICFSLLSKDDFLLSYRDANHHGPSHDGNSGRIAIMVSREELLNHFPKQVFAIGDFFWDPTYYRQKELYEYDEISKTVYGIPVIEQPGLSYPDEVRLKPHEVQKAAVSHAFWAGVVAREEDLAETINALVDSASVPSVPVFSPTGRLFVENLADFMKKVA